MPRDTLLPRKPTLIDRALSALGLQKLPPAAGLQASGYSAAGYADRFAYWMPGTRDADRDSVYDLRELRARSRDLVRNSAIGSGSQETQCAYIVGTGLTLQSHVDAAALKLEDDAARAWQADVERRFALWAGSELCDASREQDFYELQDLALRTQLESGDAFALLVQAEPMPGWPFRLALQLVEADRICNPGGKADTPELTAGIERSATGAAIAAHVCSRHPGGLTGTAGATWQRVPMRGSTGRRNVLHLKRKLRPGQSRGIPALAPIIGTLKQMARYSDAEIDAAVNAAALALFVKMDPEAFTELFDETAQGTIVDSARRWDGTLKSGAAVNLLPGESVEAPAVGRPNPNFEPFMGAFMRLVGIGLNIPHEVLAKSFQSSYSAARAALLDAWRTFRIRRAWLARRLCQPVYEEWLADEVAADRIKAPGFFADPFTRAAWCGATWSGDGPGSIDPEKDVAAAEKRMRAGITTLAEEIVAFDGGDYETKHRQRVREVAERVEGGLEAPLTAPLAPAAARAAPTTPVPAPDPEDDSEE